MKINFNRKIQTFIIILSFFIFLFPLKNVYAENITVNDSTKVLDVDHIHGGRRATEGFCFVENNLLAVCDTVITGNTDNDYADVYLYTYDFGSSFATSTSTKLEDSHIVNRTHSNSMTYDPQNKKLIIASEGMHIYSVDLQNNKILNNEQVIRYNGHAVAYDAAKNKIITYTAAKIRCFELSDFYSGDQSKAEVMEYKYPKLDHASSQGMGALGGLAFLIFSNKNSQGAYYSNTIVVYDVENDKYVTSLESDYPHEFEDCMFDSMGDLYISDTMGNVFKPGVNAYTLGATGSIAGTSTTKKSLFSYLMEFVAFSCNILSDASQALCEMCENNKTFINSLKLTRNASEIEADNMLKNKIQIKSNLVNSTAETDEASDSSQTATENQNSDTSTLKEATIPSTIEDKLGNQQTVFSYSTQIPTIEASFENFMIDTLGILDIDFFNKSNSNSNSIWMAYRKIVTTITHSVMYICAAALVVMLIIRSITLIISNIRGIPHLAKRSKQIMDNLLGAIGIIVGIFVIMAIIIYLNKLLINIIIGQNRNNFLIRLNVENVYSFNSNFMGFFKYRSLTTDVMDAAKWSFIRLIMSLINLLIFVAMIARMVIIGFLTMIAPITAVTFMRNREVQNEEGIQSLFYFRPFVSLYVRLVLFQTICALFLSIILRL